MLQLPDVVAEVSALLKRLLGEKITLSVSHDRDLLEEMDAIVELTGLGAGFDATTDLLL